MSDVVVSTLQAVAAFILVLAPLVFVHELGHFLVAKLLGIGVPVFSLGFGPRLVGFARGGTDYRISAVPLGGYVRLAGDESDENRTGAREEFLSRPRWQRFVVYVAGAVFNVVLAFLVLWLLFAAWGKNEVQNPDAYPYVVDVREGSPAERAGLRRGDTLVEIGGQDVRGAEVYDEVYNREIVLAPGTVKTVVVERAGERHAFEVPVEAHEREGYGLSPGWYLNWGSENVLIVGVEPGEPADQAGLLAGDLVVAADGERPLTQSRLRELLETHAGEPVRLDIVRQGQLEEQPAEITVTPRDREGRGFVGVELVEPPVHRDLGLVEAARESVQVNIANSKLLFTVLKRMMTGAVPLRSVSGPIGIAQYARRALIASPEMFIWLLGFFSLQLGILNLLPIPVLDGGHILILFIESVMRRDLSDRVKERMMQAGFVFLLAFMAVVFALDLGKIEWSHWF